MSTREFHASTLLIYSNHDAFNTSISFNAEPLESNLREGRQEKKLQWQFTDSKCDFNHFEVSSNEVGSWEGRIKALATRWFN